MKNWKTTAAGVVGAILIVLANWLKGGDFTDYTTLVSAAFAAAIGYFAKDAGVTGTEK